MYTQYKSVGKVPDDRKIEEYIGIFSSSDILRPYPEKIGSYSTDSFDLHMYSSSGILRDYLEKAADTGRVKAYITSS